MKLRVWLPIAAAALAAGVLCFRMLPGRSEPGPERPPIDLTALPPPVAKALDDAEQQARRNPSSAAAWGRWGMVLMAHDFAEQAVPLLAHAERLDPADFHWPYYRGMCLVFSDPPAAIVCFEKAVELRGDLAVLRLELAERLLAAGRLAEAEPHIEQALSLEPREARGLLAQARLAFLRGDLQESRDWAERSVAAAGDVRESRQLLSQVLFRLGDTEAAQRHARISSELGTRRTAWYDPLMLEVVSLCRAPSELFSHASDLSEQGRFAEAESVLQQVLSLSPDKAEVYVLLAFTRLSQGRREDAAEALDRALRLDPHSAEAHYYRGALSMVASDWEQAAQSFRTAAACKPDYAAAHYNLGQMLRELGDPEGAVAAFREALRSQPDLPVAHAALGELLLSQGRRDEAVESLATAVRLDPENGRARELLREAEAR